MLGNHDDPDQRNYPPFNMAGHRYYTFTPPANVLAGLVTDVRIFALDSTEPGRRAAGVAGRAALDSPTRAGRSSCCTTRSTRPAATACRRALFRWQIESLLVEHGADVVFSGHEHIYQRSRLQRGIQYFITGGAGSLRRGDGRETSAIASSFDRDFHFMLVEIADDAMYFQAITRAGVTVDAGVLRQD